MTLNIDQCLTRMELERIVLVGKLNCSEKDSGDAADAFCRSRAQVKLEQIERAQLRAAKGNYGVCPLCQQAIDPERLEILPYAEHCVRCQQQLERRVIGRGLTTTPQWISR